VKTKGLLQAYNYNQDYNLDLTMHR